MRRKKCGNYAPCLLKFLATPLPANLVIGFASPPHTLEMLHQRWGGGTTFHAEIRKDGHYTCVGMVYAEMFYGG